VAGHPLHALRGSGSAGYKTAELRSRAAHPLLPLAQRGSTGDFSRRKNGTIAAHFFLPGIALAQQSRYL
jgi:hypothetical protein